MFARWVSWWRGLYREMYGKSVERQREGYPSLATCMIHGFSGFLVFLWMNGATCPFDPLATSRHGLFSALRHHEQEFCTAQDKCDSYNYLDR